ncbi:hypothetical protein [Microvirga sp. VF16]|uniref:hypothetical protein n=1 Tax=Microvirga sp. VF16 TaxID=2807101 RepID=UPI00193E5047|nr:hypothetical protein [Microvirga sp. VF16]QRM27587.1 hypothetical protein JO965_14950 [Microvirga sp. VF16]
MIEVVQVFDRAPITQLDGGDATAFEERAAIARRLFKDKRVTVSSAPRRRP